MSNNYTFLKVEDSESSLNIGELIRNEWESADLEEQLLEYGYDFMGSVEEVISLVDRAGDIDELVSLDFVYSTILSYCSDYEIYFNPITLGLGNSYKVMESWYALPDKSKLLVKQKFEKDFGYRAMTPIQMLSDLSNKFSNDVNYLKEYYDLVYTTSE